MKRKLLHHRYGFTLIELIVVVAIIALVVSAVFVAIDPARRLHEGRNSDRWTDARAILEAVKKYQVDHDGEMPDDPTIIDDDEDSVQMIGEGGFGCNILSDVCPGHVFPAVNCFASGLDTDLEDYLRELPTDPKDGNSAVTYYTINVDRNDFIVIAACSEEGEGRGGEGSVPDIEVYR